MTISAKIIADSEIEGLAPSEQKRLTTFELRYPRFIHAEFMTHRVISRNASSSRAIPVDRMIRMIEEDPAIPIEFGRNQKGMQSAGEHNAPVFGDAHPAHGGTHLEQHTPQEAWLCAMRDAIRWACRFNEAGYHKQVVNRILEPYSHIKVVATATNWENFFALRAHPDAQPEIQQLAHAMLKAMGDSVPVHRPRDPSDPDAWHLPYIWESERAEKASWTSVDGTLLLRKMSAARCARVSYFTHEGVVPPPEKDEALYDRLVGSKPLHASPLEHQARPAVSMGGEAPLQGNFTGWVQFRKMHAGEFSTYKIPRRWRK